MDAISILYHAVSPLGLSGRFSDAKFTIHIFPLSISSRLNMISIALAASVQVAVGAAELRSLDVYELALDRRSLCPTRTL